MENTKRGNMKIYEFEQENWSWLIEKFLKMNEQLWDEFIVDEFQKDRDAEDINAS
jgi:hypothetical protein